MLSYGFAQIHILISWTADSRFLYASTNRRGETWSCRLLGASGSHTCVLLVKMKKGGWGTKQCWTVALSSRPRTLPGAKVSSFEFIHENPCPRTRFPQMM